MASDRLVGANLILRAQLEVQRRGAQEVIRDLEYVEPDLAEFLIERLTDLHRQILDLRGRPKDAGRLYRQTESLLLTSILALRQAHFELWRRDNPDADPPQDDASQPP